MTAQQAQLCDCPEPSGCYAEGYAAGKDKAYFEMMASLEDTPHSTGCGCSPCQVKQATMRTLLTMMANWSPHLFEQVEAWALENHDAGT